MRPEILFRFLATGCALAFSAGAISSDRSPYSGEEVRDIKSLSAAEIDGLLDGKGLGYAKAAELNGYPGPSHVLELAEELALSADQRAASEAAFASMQSEAREWGAKLVEAERELDQRFKSQTIAEVDIVRMLEQIASLQAGVRAAHLKAHLVQRRILTAEQTANYMRLRGYGDGAHPHAHRHNGG